MQSLIEPFYIVSTFSDHIKDNVKCFEEVRQAFISHEVNFKQVEGKYKGKSELSFLLTSFKIAYSVAAMFHQETYLKVNSDRSSYLVSVKTGHQMYVGQWSETDKVTDNCSIIDDKIYSTF